MTRSFRPSITRILVELGETNMRCALLDKGEMHDVRVYKLADFKSFAEAIDHYCRELSFKREAQMGLLIALAPQPQTDGVYFFKHHPSWNFKARDLMQELGLASIHLLNDLESHAYAVLGGERGETLFAGTPRKEGPVAVIAPGTGLGFAYVYPELGYVQQAFGAHMHFHGLGSDDPHYAAIKNNLLYPFTTFEDVVSGPGLKILRDRIGEQEADHYFNQVFGLFIHHVVLFSHSLGGVVITGGLIPALLKEKRIDWNVVREAYQIENIPAVTQGLENVPWSIVDDPQLGLKGLVAWANINIDDTRR